MIDKYNKHSVHFNPKNKFLESNILMLEPFKNFSVNFIIEVEGDNFKANLL